jgi:hypothetical protein
MADYRLDGAGSRELAADGWRHRAALTRDDDTPVIQTVAVIATIDIAAFNRAAAQALHVCESGGQYVTIIGIAGQRQHAEDQSFAVGRGDRDLDAEVVALARLAFRQTLDLRRVQRIELGMIGPPPNSRTASDRCAISDKQRSRRQS